MTLFWRIGCVSMVLAVALGAFGAHALADIEPRLLAIWQKAVFYHVIHSLALLILAGVLKRTLVSVLSGWSFIVGVLLFSGSLYSYTLVEIKWIVMLTPIGGMLFIVGWILAALCVPRGSVDTD